MSINKIPFLQLETVPFPEKEYLLKNNFLFLQLKASLPLFPRQQDPAEPG